MSKSLVCLLIASSLALVGCQRGTQFGPEDTTALQQNLEAYITDLRDGNVDSIMDSVVKSPRPLMYGVTSQKTQGWDEVKASLQQIFDTWTFDAIRITDSHHKGDGQLGVSYGELLIQATNAGTQIEIPVRFTRVYGKRESRWELLHQHTSVPNDMSSYLNPPMADAGS